MAASMVWIPGPKYLVLEEFLPVYIVRTTRERCEESKMLVSSYYVEVLRALVAEL